MFNYIVKRLLIMIPTFFGISLIVFVVLNFAPGHPGGAKQAKDLASTVRGSRSQESHRIFREQFNLDKPIIFNTLYALTQDEIGRELLVFGDPSSSDAQRIHAQEKLEDYGKYSIPHLIRIMEEAAERIQDPSKRDPNLEFDLEDETLQRDLAVYFLRINARQRLIDPLAKSLGDETKEANRKINAENAKIQLMRYALEDSEEKKLAIIGQWKSWYLENAERWDYSSGKLRIFFLETRFAKYWSNLLKLDFGYSLVTREPVMDILASKLKYSISLSIISILLAYLISIPIGIYSAVDKDSPTDRALTTALFMLYSLPSFFVATLLLYFFSEGSDYPALKWFPTGRFRSSDYMQMTSLEQIKDIAWHLTLPLICLTYGSFAALSRYMRAGLLDVIRADYIRTARAKGLPEWKVIVKHAVRNGLLPILTLLAALLPAVLGGAVIIEQIFSIPGMGQWMIESIHQRDYNAIMAVQLVSTILVLIGILFSDLSYALADPRITYK